MKTTIIILLASLTLTGCNVFQTKQAHTNILVETVKDICGAGLVSVESMNNGSDTENESTFKFKCTIDKIKAETK